MNMSRGLSVDSLQTGNIKCKLDISMQKIKKGVYRVMPVLCHQTDRQTDRVTLPFIVRIYVSLISDTDYLFNSREPVFFAF